MKILIYDDCETDIENLIILIKNFFKLQNIAFDITICDSTNYLLKNIMFYDLLFLDIEINEENGIDIGLKLNEINHNCRILITSHFKKYIIEGYKINADRYFLKPISQFEFNVEMQNEIKQYLKKYQGFLDSRISPNKILFSDILYVDVYDRKTRIHFKNRKIICTPYLLKDLKLLLDNEYFMQVHKSFIINLNYVSGYSKQDLFLIDGESIPISRNYKRQFEQRYIEILPRLF